MFLFACLFAFSFQFSSCKLSASELIWIEALAGVVLLLAIFEVLGERAWAGHFTPAGARIFRPSSTMLNPNVLGLWGALILFLDHYFRDTKALMGWRGWLLGFIGLSAIFLSGSRSSLIFCFAVLFLGALLKRLTGMRLITVLKRPVILFFIFILICAGAQLTVNFFPTASPLVHLINRFLSLPQELFVYLANLLQIDIPDGNTRLLGIREGVEGRLLGSDNGHRIIAETSLILYWIWSLMLLFSVIIGVLKFFRKKDLQSVYALSSLFGFIFIGLIIRAYQVFPVWGLSALLLGVFINWVMNEEKETHTITQ